CPDPASPDIGRARSRVHQALEIRTVVQDVEEAGGDEDVEPRTWPRSGIEGIRLDEADVGAAIALGARASPRDLRGHDVAGPVVARRQLEEIRAGSGSDVEEDRRRVAMERILELCDEQPPSRANAFPDRVIEEDTIERPAEWREAVSLVPVDVVDHRPGVEAGLVSETDPVREPAERPHAQAERRVGRVHPSSPRDFTRQSQSS